MNYKEIKGDLIKLALAGQFDVVAHGCNCQCNMGAGIAPQMARAFGADKFLMELSDRGNINKLGQIDYRRFYITEGTVFGNMAKPENTNLAVVNAYTQFNYGKNHADGTAKPLDYEALTLCLRKMNHTFKGKHIGLPQIGCGLAGGDWLVVRSIIQKELKDCNVTIVIYERN
jgi:O-acetyl-ADP-ribose deacetylase (regulator of RNase III)